MRKTTVKSGHYLFHSAGCSCEFGVMDFQFAPVFEGQLKCKCGDSIGIYSLMKIKGWWYVIPPTHKDGDPVLGQRTMKQAVRTIELTFEKKTKRPYRRLEDK